MEYATPNSRYFISLNCVKLGVYGYQLYSVTKDGNPVDGRLFEQGEGELTIRGSGFYPLEGTWNEEAPEQSSSSEEGGSGNGGGAGDKDDL